jgi:CHAD domain-containing protein
MTHDLQNILRLAEKLRENLTRCAEDPNVDSVHDVRTGTRRLQATLESLARESPEGDAGARLREGAMATMRLLKKIRRAAGPVRDLDVHRKLLSKLTKRALQPEVHEDAGGAAEPRVVVAGEPDVLESPEAGLRATGLDRQAEELDAWLNQRRSEVAQGLRKAAPGLAAKFDKRMGELEEALRSRRGRARKKRPAVVALDSFARLATEMQLLDAGNLHDFRKGAKKARYVAELAAQGDTEAQKVGETLKKLQDEIGDWHDWLVLAEEAHTALGRGAAELTALVEGEREQHFVAAMKMAAKLRGRLMGEWLAVAGARPAQRRSPVRPGGTVSRR